MFTNTAFQPVVFERRSAIGGLWNLELDPGPCNVDICCESKPQQDMVNRGNYAYSVPSEVHYTSPMYEGLRVNVPLDLMAYRDFPFPEDLPLFPERTVVYDYLIRFGKSVEIEKYVRLNTHVSRVYRDGGVWHVESEGPDGARNEEFDRIVIASGWCNVPYVPSVPVLSKFKGKNHHSAWYRSPLDYRGKRVLVVGNFSSGADIVRELTGGIVRKFDGSDEWIKQSAGNPPGTGVTVYHAYRNPENPPPLDYDPRDPSSPDWCRRINVVGPIDHIDDDGKVVLQDGTILDVDVIVWGTGFWRALPYIDHAVEPFKSRPLVAQPGQGVHFQQNAADKPEISASPQVGGASCTTNLDDWQIFYEPDKSVALLGVPTHVIPFALTQVQARVVASYWAGVFDGLRPISRQKGTCDPEKWSSERNVDDVDAPVGAVIPVNHRIRTPSEEAYVDALLSHLPGQGQQQPDWDHGPESARGREGWDKTTSWRIDRLKNRVQLRRANLGY